MSRPDKNWGEYQNFLSLREQFLLNVEMLQTNVLRVLILFSINNNLEDKKLLKVLNIFSYTQLQTETGEKVTIHTTILSVPVELKA